MTPRINLKRGLAYLLLLSLLFVLLVNLQQTVLIASGSNEHHNPIVPHQITTTPRSEQRKESDEKFDEKKEDSGSVSRTVSKPSVLNSSYLWPRLLGRKLDLSPLDPQDKKVPDVEERPWYMKGGRLLPSMASLDSESGQREATLLPCESVEGDDRIPDQLMFFPPEGVLPVEKAQDLAGDAHVDLKMILMWNGLTSWGNSRPGRGSFIKAGCPVSSCVLSSQRKDYDKADLVLFKDHFAKPSFERPQKQLWMMFMLESPLHTQSFKQPSVFNWTATYRSDSTVVAPYERWQYYNGNVRSIPQPKNYAANKTKLVAWFVSNCGAKNGRLQYARQLQEFISVDIYGSCGSKSCPRSRGGECFDMLDNDYKFYLAFENSNCKDYITEKFFVNGLGRDVLPIVMGARPEDYARSAPEHSYLHVDDFEGPKHLAEYLHKLDQDDDLYNSYFAWKGTGEFLNTNFFCRVCAMLHDPKIYSEEYIRSGQNYVADMNEWWRGSDTCITGSWYEHYRRKNKVADSIGHNAGFLEEMSVH